MMMVYIDGQPVEIREPLLSIKKKEIIGPQVSYVVHGLELSDLRVRGMVEEFTPAAARRALERVADRELL